MAHEEIIWETLKNYVTSSNNLQKNNFYDLTWNFGQLHKYVQHSRFCLLDSYILSTHLLISWHTYGNHIYLCHYTYKCNFLTWMLNNISKYILVSKNYNNAHFAWHTYGNHICLCHYTYKCNFLTWTLNNRSKYILVSKKLQ